MKKSVPIEDKLYFVKLLTSKMEERAGSDTKMMVASINAKLEMINQLIG
jgi:malonyl CoA-acyl carrier protein transacylase